MDQPQAKPFGMLAYHLGSKFGRSLRDHRCGGVGMLGQPGSPVGHYRWNNLKRRPFHLAGECFTKNVAPLTSGLPVSHDKTSSP